MTKTPLSVFRGDTQVYNITFKDENDVAIDITGWTLFMTVKINENDPDSSAIISKTVTSFPDPTNGKATISLSPTDTDQLIDCYFYDMQLKDSSGNITTYLSGIFNVTRDITIRES